jgi:hypothetical protein
MHEELVNLIQSQRATSATTNDYISQLVSGRATLSLHLNLNDGATSILTTSSPPPLTHSQQTQHFPSSQQQQHPELSALEEPPTYAMSRGIQTINDLHREWYNGLSGGYPVAELEQRWGVQWRKDMKERKFFNRRRSIIDTITKYAEQHHITIETAVNIAEEKRRRQNKSLHYLSEHNDRIFD